VLRPVLGAAGHDVTTAASGAEALRQADLLLPDVILLDLGLPDQDGKAVIRTLRIKHDIPIIVISARHQEGEKIAALDEGADDYVDKPFEIGELMARIRVVLRRKPGAEAATHYKSGPLSIDFETRHVMLGGSRSNCRPRNMICCWRWPATPGVWSRTSACSPRDGVMTAPTRNICASIWACSARRSKKIPAIRNCC